LSPETSNKKTDASKGNHLGKQNQRFSSSASSTGGGNTKSRMKFVTIRREEGGARGKGKDIYLGAHTLQTRKRERRLKNHEYEPRENLAKGGRMNLTKRDKEKFASRPLLQGRGGAEANNTIGRSTRDTLSPKRERRKTFGETFRLCLSATSETRGKIGQKKGGSLMRVERKVRFNLKGCGEGSRRRNSS